MRPISDSGSTMEIVHALVQEVATACETRGYTLAVAESCTGGGLAAAITDLAGVSSFFLGGVVSYANEVKMELLGVPSEVLATDGAVSEPTALAMSAGVRRLVHSDVGVGITGIAGPGGDTPTKPVGLVYISVATPRGSIVRHDVWPGDRAAVRSASVERALRLILECLQA